MATELDLTFENTVTVNGAILSTDVETVGAGTGLIDPFVRISSNNPTEQGYNTDASPKPLDDTNSFVRALSLSSVPIQIVDGKAYYRFELDINQINSSGNLLSLDAIQIWQAGSGTLNDYAPGATP